MNYKLHVSKDQDGQPLRMFRRHAENNVSKAIDQLAGICTGILADGEINDAEAQFFADWVRKYAPLEPVWPFTDILARVERIFADGHCDAEEMVELRGIMEALCGHTADRDDTEIYSTTLPLCDPAPDPVIFLDRPIVVTGRFAYGTRKKVFEAVEALGGFPGDGSPTQATRCLVIGSFASRDWYNTNYGRKIERAVELRNSGSDICIISEQHWKKFVS